MPSISIIELLFAVIPPLAVLLLSWFIARNGRLPIIIIAFGLVAGMLSTQPAGFLEQILLSGSVLPMGNSLDQILIQFIAGVGCVEEGTKLIGAVIVMLAFRKRLKFRYDVIVISASSAMGFALLENVLYVISASVSQGTGMYTAIARMFTAIPMHLIDSLVMGLFIGYALQCRLHNDRGGFIRNCVLCYVIPSIIHGIYDAMLSVSSGSGTFLALLTLAFGFAIGIFILIYYSRHDMPIRPDAKLRDAKAIDVIYGRLTQQGIDAGYIEVADFQPQPIPSFASNYGYAPQPVMDPSAWAPQGQWSYRQPQEYGQPGYGQLGYGQPQPDWQATQQSWNNS